MPQILTEPCFGSSMSELSPWILPSSTGGKNEENVFITDISDLTNKRIKKKKKKKKKKNQNKRMMGTTNVLLLFWSVPRHAQQKSHAFSHSLLWIKSLIANHVDGIFTNDRYVWYVFGIHDKARGITKTEPIFSKCSTSTCPFSWPFVLW